MLWSSLCTIYLSLVFVDRDRTRLTLLKAAFVALLVLPTILSNLDPML